MRRIGPLVLVFVFVHAADALALAGGGSGGYGGGGGGGGGGSYGGGGSGSGSGGGLVFWLILVVVFLCIFGSGWIAAIRYRRKRRARVARVRTAAAEAAQDDAAFDVEAVIAQAEQLFRDAQAAWDARDRARLKELIPPDLWTEWERRLDDFDRKGWHNRVEVRKADVEYVGMTNRERDQDDRCVVRIEATVRDYVEDAHGRHIKRSDSSSEVSTVVQYWTLAKSGDTDRWMLASIEERKEGDHHLDEEIVATPWGDDDRLRDQSLVEGAVADAPQGVPTAEIADLDFDGDARAAANDLSLADPRFAPDILEVAARRAVSAWADAVDGEDTGLAAVSTPQALRQLLHPDDPSEKTRVVVRGPHVERLRIVALDAAAQPATMTIEVSVRGRRYIEDRGTTTVVSGSRDRESHFTECWKLALDGADDTPWRIVDAAAPADAAAA